MIDFLKLGLETFENEDFNNNKITYRKEMGKILSKARQQSKLNKCYYCGKATTQFCNSHFVPRFCLKNISVNGEVYYSNTLVNMPLLDYDKGINEAGTFRIICRDCDSKIFSDYEDPNNYECQPTSKMLAQIALKNYLKYISKRLMEDAMYNIASENSPQGKNWATAMHNINSLDLIEFQKSFEKAK